MPGMTVGPEKPRSELVIPANPCGDWTCDTFRMFQIASPASWSPALRPTRGSGDGARTSGAERSGTRAIAGVAIELDDDERAQPATASDPITPRSVVARNRIIEKSTGRGD